MSEKEFEAELTVKDRLNFPYLLANQILTIQKAILNQDFSDREIREAVDGLVWMIPKVYKDKDFEKDEKEAEVVMKIPTELNFCGVPPSTDFCKEYSIDPFTEVTTYDPFKLLHACMNLLERKKMLSRIMRIEELENIDLDNIPDDALIEGDLSSK